MLHSQGLRQQQQGKDSKRQHHIGQLLLSCRWSSVLSVKAMHRNLPKDRGTPVTTYFTDSSST